MTDTTEQLLRVNPGQLVIDANIRKTVSPSKEFISSIKQHGVLIPILVDQTEDGTYRVVDGQLRTIVAMDTGRTDVPIVIQSTRTAADRLLEQLVVNDHRAGIVDADRAAAYQELFEMGVSADALARKTNTPKKRVEAALSVAQSPYASEVLKAGNVTLDHAAAIVEFEADPEIAEQLGTIALENPSRFDHAITQARMARDSARIHAEAAAGLEALGYTITEEIPYHHSASKAIARIDYLFLDKDFTQKLASAPDEQIAPREGLKAVLDDGYKWGTNNERIPITRVYFFLDGWAEQGLYVKPHMLSTSSSGSGGGLTDEEKAKRRTARENNKLWVPATAVRIQWVKDLLQSKELPSGWELFVALFVAKQNANDYRSANLLPDLLQWTQDDGRPHPRGEYLDKNPTRAAHYLIGAAIAAVEGEYEFGKKGWNSPNAPAYLTQLSKWGYTLSELEEQVKNGKARQ